MDSRELPVTEQEEKEVPSKEQPKKKKPSAEQSSKKKPPVGNPENMVMMAGTPVEIKPTKLKYIRNRTAYFYKALDTYPLPDILADEILFDPQRDGDKCLMDWLIAVTDDPDLVTDVYDAIDAETVYRLLAVFKRVNHFDEREENLKNRLAAIAQMESLSKTGSR